MTSVFGSERTGLNEYEWLRLSWMCFLLATDDHWYSKSVQREWHWHELAWVGFISKAGMSWHGIKRPGHRYRIACDWKNWHELSLNKIAYMHITYILYMRWNVLPSHFVV